jgi:hypothetical protein
MSKEPPNAEFFLSEHLPRLRQLYDKSDKSHRDNYFMNIRPHFFEWGLPARLRQIEALLCPLDVNAWEKLLKKTLPFVTERDRRRGYYQLFNHLNEARGWALLFDRGYTEICFIESGANKTPDFWATKSNSMALLEVKTIGQSDKDIYSIANGPPQVVNMGQMLPDEFKRKVARTIDIAKRQLETHAGTVDERIVMLVVHLDSKHQTGHNEFELAQLISDQAVMGLEIVHQVSLP